MLNYHDMSRGYLQGELRAVTQNIANYERMIAADHVERTAKWWVLMERKYDEACDKQERISTALAQKGVV